MRNNYILILLFCCIAAYSQTAVSKIDSLESIIRKGTAERKFQRIHELADLYSDSDLKKAQYYAKEAITLAQKEKNDNFLGLAYNTLGNILQYKSELDSSLIYTRKSLELRIKNKDSIGIADSYNNLGIVYDQKADYPESLKNYFRALKIYERKKDEKKQAMTASNIGVVYKSQRDFAKSLKYYFLAYNIYRKQKNEFGIAVTTGNIGSTFIPFKKYQEALNYSKLSEEGYRKLGYDRFRGYPVSNMAIVYDSLRNYGMAKKFYQKAIQLHEQYENGVEVADNSKFFAEFLYRQKNYPESITYAQKALRFAQTSDANLIENDAQLILAKAYAATGKYDLAYQNQEKHIEGKEKIFETQKTKSVLELEKKYQTEKKDLEILTQKSKLFKRNVAVFSLFGLLFLGLIYYKNYQNKQKVKLQKEILHQQDLSAKAVMDMQITERKRMATQLHDGVGQLLSAANMNASVLDDFREQESEFQKILKRTQDILKEAITDVRTLSHEIMPNMLIKNSLANALRELIEKSNSPKLHIGLTISGLEENLDQNIQVVLYRTIQECINNTVKHAGADQIQISVLQDQEKVTTVIADNGCGFDTSKVNSRNDGLGLESIRSRIDLMKGTMVIKSEENVGTEITVSVPVNT